MPAAVINKVEAGHADEQADCCMTSLATYLGVAYTDCIRFATVFDRQAGKRGLTIRAVKRIAAELGHPLRSIKFTEDVYGIIFAPSHAAVLRNELVIDRASVWPLDVWMKEHKARPTNTTILITEHE